MQLLHFIRSLVLPSDWDRKPEEGAITGQWRIITSFFTAESPSSVGFERFSRLMFSLLGFIWPGLYVREFGGRLGYPIRKLAIDIYVAFKVVFPVVALSTGLYRSLFVLCVTVYLMAETVAYLIGVFLLDDVYSPSFSRRRSFFLVLFNYFEITFDFAVLYRGLAEIDKIKTTIDAIYFSTVTSTTLGYGDIVPEQQLGRLLVVAHVSTMAILLVAVLNAIAPKSAGS